MPRAAPFETSIGMECWRDAVELSRELDLREELVDVGSHGEHDIEVRVASPERIGQRQQDPVDFGLFFFGERHRLVVELDGGEWLKVQAGAAGRTAVHNAGNRLAMF